MRPLISVPFLDLRLSKATTFMTIEPSCFYFLLFALPRFLPLSNTVIVEGIEININSGPVAAGWLQSSCVVIFYV